MCRAKGTFSACLGPRCSLARRVIRSLLRVCTSSRPPLAFSLAPDHAGISLSLPPSFMNAPSARQTVSGRFQSRISRLDEARTMSFHAFSSICVLFRHFVASFYISRNEFVRSFVFRFVITRIVILFVSLIIYAACLYKLMSYLCDLLCDFIYEWYMYGIWARVYALCKILVKNLNN